LQKCAAFQDLQKNSHNWVGRSWHIEHVWCLSLKYISYRFWNKGGKLLKLRKFDEKSATTPKWAMGFHQICKILIMFVLYTKKYKR
jgi:hypothetical protein